MKKKDTLGIKPEIYDKMINSFKKFSIEYTIQGTQGMLEGAFQSVSLKKIKAFIDQQSK